MNANVKKVAIALAISAGFMLIYNKVPAVRRALGGA